MNVVSLYPKLKTMRKTLVIHPKDRSTEFLKPIYEKIPDVTVCEGGITKKVLKELIQEHDRVIMLGHGCPQGLFNVGGFLIDGRGGLIIDSTTVPFLETKKDNIYIWCNADKFVNQFLLKGFYSGMFISEVGEAYYCGVYKPTKNMVKESNDGFSIILGNHVNKSSDEIFESVVHEYSVLSDINPVANYNCGRLYKR